MVGWGARVKGEVEGVIEACLRCRLGCLRWSGLGLQQTVG